MGPWIVSKDEIPDPHQLDISLCLSMEETCRVPIPGELICKVPRLISYISTMMPLVPGGHHLHRYSGWGGNGAGLRSDGSGPETMLVIEIGRYRQPERTLSSPEP